MCNPFQSDRGSCPLLFEPKDDIPFELKSKDFRTYSVMPPAGSVKLHAGWPMSIPTRFQDKRMQLPFVEPRDGIPLVLEPRFV
jgi:hypothetical protein